MPKPVGVDVWDLLKLLCPGLVVLARGKVCRVVGFDMIQGRHTMPVTLKPLDADEAFVAPLPEIEQVMVPVDHQSYSREVADRPAAVPAVQVIPPDGRERGRRPDVADHGEPFVPRRMIRRLDQP